MNQDQLENAIVDKMKLAHHFALRMILTQNKIIV